MADQQKAFKTKGMLILPGAGLKAHYFLISALNIIILLLPNH